MTYVSFSAPREENNETRVYRWCVLATSTCVIFNFHLQDTEIKRVVKIVVSKSSITIDTFDLLE